MMIFKIAVLSTAVICALFWAGAIVNGFYRWRNRKFGRRYRRLR